LPFHYRFDGDACAARLWQFSKWCGPEVLLLNGVFLKKTPPFATLKKSMEIRDLL